MKSYFNATSRVMCLIFLLCFSTCYLQAQLIYQTNAIGNDWLGAPLHHVQNHINNMTVAPDGTCYTQSVWDEGGNSSGVYKDGKHINNNGGSSKANSKVVTDKNGKTWTIMNYFGRFLSQFPSDGGIGYKGEDYDKYVLPVPVGANAPYIKCSDGREIRTVKDPSAIGINHKTGELLVADQTIAQNIKIFNISNEPVLVDSFGMYGGVWSGSNPGLMDNMLKFAGITGVGADTLGNIYVSNTIVNKEEGSGGGVDLRSFKPDGTLNWRARGVLFLVAGSVDPASDGQSIVSPFFRFSIDYSKAAGQNWQVEATNINPFKYPDDPRLICSAEDLFAYKYINGKRYLLMTDMYMNGVYLYRMEGEIAVPCAVFCGSYGWNGDEHNRLNWKWHRGRPDMPRWLWCDRNGDGKADSLEFETFDIGLQANAMDFDNNGNFYLGTGNKEIVMFPTNGFDKFGNPQYTAASIKVIANVNNPVHTMKWIEETDMFVHGNDYGISKIDVWKNWSKPNRSVHLTISLPATNGGSAVQVTADKEYVYVAWSATGGPNTHKEGEVTVYNINTGAFVGYIIPGPEVGSHSGWIDMKHSTKVFTRFSGERIVSVEEDHVGKILVYQWCPDGNCNKQCTSNIDSVLVDSSISITGFDSDTVKAKVYPDTACYTGVSWTSSDEKIATVDRFGKVSSVGVGNAYIIATHETQKDKADSCLLTVSNVAVESIKIIGDTIDVLVFKSTTIPVNISPANAINRKCNWLSDDTTIAKVDSMGKITALKKGYVQIIVTSVDGSYKDTCVINAIPIPVTGIYFKLNQSGLWPNDSLILNPIIQPLDASNKTIIWESSMPTIASVNSNGIVKGITVGKTLIIAKTQDGNFSDTLVVNVFEINKLANQDVGDVCVKGSVLENNKVYTIVAGGVDIWDYEDGFHFVYRKLKGDGVIIAQVIGVDSTSDWAKAGVMMRDNLETNSKHSSMLVTHKNGSTFQRRTLSGWISDHTTPNDAKKAPLWVKLVRKGNKFIGYNSINGRVWNLIGEEEFKMQNNLYVGLCLTSHNDCEANTSTFDNLIITNNVDTTIGSPNTPPSVSITSPENNASFIVNTSIRFSALAFDDDAVKKVELYNGSTLIATDATSPYTLFFTPKNAGEYSITAKATDTEGVFTESVPVIINIKAANIITSLNTTGSDNNIKVYPNPAKNEVTIEFKALQNTSNNLQVFDMVGKLMHFEKILIQQGNNVLKLNTSNLNSGLYIIKMNGKSEQISIVNK